MIRWSLMMLLSLMAPFGAAQAASDGSALTPDSDCDASLATGSSNLDVAVVAYDEDVMTINCRHGRIESLAITLPPGSESRIELGLVYRSERAAPLTVRVAAPADSNPDADLGWLAAATDVAEAGVDRAVPVSVTVRAGRRFEPGSIHRLQVEFVVGDNRASALLPVTLTVGDESPLFRSRFEVDPVLGQFSYRPAKTRSRGMVSSLPVAAGGE